uniref:Zona pellucida sperm-binding protein 3 n=1 Tax=Fundulus heteroclitus TaxID=8078 RepID=A0A3Q2TXD6_FUNHE
MPRFSVCFMLSLCLLRARSYTYQSEPLFLTYSELAALEAAPQSEAPAASEDHQALVVSCQEDSMEIVMRPHLLHPDPPVELVGLRLGPPGSGGDGCTARRSEDGAFIIRAPLAECGSRVTLTDSAVLYSNTLVLFFAGSSPGEAVQVDGAAVPLLCRYKRRYLVSSGALRPTWASLVSDLSAHLSFDFYLRLMTDDWSSERHLPVYFMNEKVNIQASIGHHHHHPPLRLYAGSCVATLTPDVDSHPRYPFIDRQGCFTDSQLRGSSSSFLPRVRDDLLHIQLEPFLFHQDRRHSIYITCYLEVVPVSKKHPEKKACFFTAGRWRSADGDDRVCESCDGAGEAAGSRSADFIHERVQRSNLEHRLNELHRKTTLGPITFLPEQE